MTEAFDPNRNPEAEVQPSPAELDRAVLADLTARAIEPGKYFGKDMVLSEDERHQLGLLVSQAEAVLEPQYNDPDWQKFVALQQEGSDKGILLTFVNHDATYVQKYVRNGGDGVQVKKILDPERENNPGIEVPSNVYNLLHWHNAVKRLGRYAKGSDDLLSGTATKPLGEVLRQMSHLIKKPDESTQS